MASVEDIKAQITAQGDVIREMKASMKEGKQLDIKPEVDKLLALKQAYKDLTGEEFAPPGQAKKEKKKKGGGEGQKQEQKKKDGPSKKDLKKLERKANKAAKKAENKQEKSATKGQEAAIGRKPKAKGGKQKKTGGGGSKRSSFTSAQGELSLFAKPESLATVKCLIAAQMLGVQLQLAAEKPPGALAIQEAPVLFGQSGLVLSGEGSIVRYLAMAKGRWDETDFLADQWVEWDARLFSPAVEEVARLVASGKELPLPPSLTHVMYEENSFFYKAAASVAASSPNDEVGQAVSDLTSCLAYLEDRVSGAMLLSEVVDAVVGPTAQKAVQLLPNRYPNVEAYVAKLTETTAFKEGQAAMEAVPSAQNFAPIDESAGLLSTITEIFTQALLKAYPLAGETAFKVAQVVRCAPNPKVKVKFGDFQCNSPMGLYKALKDTPTPASRPHEVANQIIANIPSNGLIEEVSVAGPGFINIFLKAEFISERISEILIKGPSPPKTKKLKVAVDFSSPNIAKDMHVGHLRSTIIGDTVCRTLEYVGHEVLRVNHVGDWGTQFGMLIQYIKEDFPDFLTNPPNIQDLTAFYKGARAKFEADAEFKKKSQLNVVDLQSGDPDCRKIWNLLCDISRKEFQKVYDRLDVRLDECGESFYNSMIPGTLEELDKLNLLKEDDGAKIIFLDHFKFPLIVQKRDGGYGYDSTDMAAVRYRIKDLKCDWVVYITDMGQGEHFNLIFEAAKAAGWAEKVRLDHIGFGVVQGEDGKKFKTRSGDTVRLVDLLDAAVDRMQASLEERVKEGKSPLVPEEIHHAASAIGYGAVKYFDQSQHPTTDYAFSYDRMLDTRGNTAVYLLFAHARLASIIRKAKELHNVDIEKLKSSGSFIKIDHPSERGLAFELLQLGDVVERVLADLTPNRICDYLYNLSTSFTDFVTNCKVLGTPEQTSRLLLCEATGTVMRKCFELLGVTPLFKI